MDDSELVETARRGDPNALAAVYDRYTDRVHDFAYAILRDRAEADDVVQETFEVAFERLGQLGDPSRLGPWLYAIAHFATLRRAGQQAVPADMTAVVPLAATPSEARPAIPPPASGPTQDELAEFVWQAAGSLGPRDRALLDLHLRQGLDGRDLADAVGVTTPHATAAINRLLTQVQRSLGALLVARTTRRDCPRLSEILTGWNGVLTPELRAQIIGHVDDCETCNSRRRLVLNPLALLSAAQLVPSPANLRRVVLNRAGNGPAAVEPAAAAGAGGGWIFNADGFPYQGGDRRIDLPATGPTAVITPNRAGAYGAGGQRGYTPPTTVTPMAERNWPAPPPVPPPIWRSQRGVLIGTLAGVIVLIAGIFALTSGRDNGGSSKVAVTAPSTAAPPTATPTTAASTTTTRPPAPTTVPPGHFVVGAKGLDFGGTGTTQSLLLRNDGAVPLTFTATAPTAALTISPASGSIEPAASTTLGVTFDRATAPKGQFSTAITISSGSGTAVVAVTAEVDPGPAITDEKASPDTVCLPTTTTAAVMAQVVAPVPIDSKGVILVSQPPTGAVTDAKMTVTGSTVTGTLGPYSAASSIKWWITATDAQGQSTRTVDHFLTVGIC